MKKRTNWGKRFMVGVLFSSLIPIQGGQQVFAEDMGRGPVIKNASLLAGKTVREMLVPRRDGEQRITADHLVWTPSSSENLLGGADDFNAILFDSFINFHETGGPVAAGTFDNVNIVTFEEGLVGSINQFSDYKLPKFNVGLIAQNSIKNKKITIHNGDVVLNADESRGMVAQDLGMGETFIDPSSISTFMEQAKNDLTLLNERLSQLPETGTIILDNYSRMRLVTTPGLNVFEMDPRISTDIDIIDSSKENTIIIKVKGNKIDFRSISLNGVAINYENTNQIANRILWVFDPSIQEITFEATNLIGSVLAPKGNITLNGGYNAINGTLIANGLNGNNSSSELHYIGRYIGKLSQTPTPPEESSEPENSSTPEESSVPESSSTPEESSEPENSSTPEESSESESSSTPETSSESESSSTPEESSVPESSSTPEESSEPESSSTPEESSEPESSSMPEESSEPEDPNKQNVFESSEEIKVPNQKLPQRGGGNQTTGKKPESTTEKRTQEKTKPYKKLPQTGDSSDAYGKWITTLGVGLLLIARILYIRRK